MEGAADFAGIAIAQIGPLNHEDARDTPIGIDPRLRSPHGPKADISDDVEVIPTYGWRRD